MVSTTLDNNPKSFNTAESKTTQQIQSLTYQHQSQTSNGYLATSEPSTNLLNDKKISMLFPKCRPKSDVNFNPVHIPISSPTSSLSSESTVPTKSPNCTTNPFLQPDDVIHQHTEDTYQYGRDYCNKLHLNLTGTTSTSNDEIGLNTAQQCMQRNHQLSGYGQHKAMTYNYNYHSHNPFKDKYMDHRIRTPSTTPVSTVLNSPEVTDNETRLGYHNQSHHIQVGCSPVNHSANDGNHIDALETPTKSMAVVADGEIVVFDDIAESWQSLRIANVDNENGSEQEQFGLQKCENKNGNSNGRGGNGYYSTTSIQKPTNFAFYKANEYLDRKSYISVRDQIDKSPTEPTVKEPYESKPLSGIIEYDGSPRRIGHKLKTDPYAYYSTVNKKSPCNSTVVNNGPRPGFPQRVTLNNNGKQECGSDYMKSPVNNPTSSFFNSDDTCNDVSEIGTTSEFTLSEPPKSSTFDYLYEFSETRKVLEEFFKCPSNEEKTTLENGSDIDSIVRSTSINNSNYCLNRRENEKISSMFQDMNYDYKIDNSRDNDISDATSNRPGTEQDGSKTAMENPNADTIETYNGLSYGNTNHVNDTSPNYPNSTSYKHDVDYFLDTASKSSEEMLDGDGKPIRSRSNCFRYSPETTDYDSNYGDLDSLSGEFNGVINYTNFSKYYTSMPILEDGLSSGHASDSENNNPGGISVLMDKRKPDLVDFKKSLSPNSIESYYAQDLKRSPDLQPSELPSRPVLTPSQYFPPSQPPPSLPQIAEENHNKYDSRDSIGHSSNSRLCRTIEQDMSSLYTINMSQLTPPPPAPAPHRKSSIIPDSSADVQNALNDIRSTIQRTKSLAQPIIEKNDSNPVTQLGSPVWIPRQRNNSNETLNSEQPLKNMSGDEEEPDTDLETDRLLGHQRLDDMNYYDDKSWCEKKPKSLLANSLSKFSSSKDHQTNNKVGGSIFRQRLGSILPVTPEMPAKPQTGNLLDIGESSPSPGQSAINSPDKQTQQTIVNGTSPNGSNKSQTDLDKPKKGKSKEVLIEGVLFRARYLGSTQLVCEGQPTKSTRMMQAEEAVSRIKALAPEGEIQPSTEVDLFISTEKIMVLNTDLKEIMMDHALRTISYIADIGDLVVLMARRRFLPNEMDDAPKPSRTPKMICHVFESEEAQFIAQSIGQAFQVAYMEFLKANGIEDHSFVKEMDYQEVLNSQEIFGDELEIFAKKELQKEVVVPKSKGEILGVVIVESGWGSMLPTVVIANLLSAGAAARCGQLNIGDQIIAINGLSLVGLPLSTCQTYIKNTKNQTVVKFTVVPCPPVVEVKIKRPNTKYQLGFSVQNGVICSLLRGGIAERGGVRVGHRIIEINNQSVVAVPHEKIVNLLATSVGEILMKTMPTSMFRLLTGQENPIYI